MPSSSRKVDFSQLFYSILFLAILFCGCNNLETRSTSESDLERNFPPTKAPQSEPAPNDFHAIAKGSEVAPESHAVLEPASKASSSSTELKTDEKVSTTTVPSGGTPNRKIITKSPLFRIIDLKKTNEEDGEAFWPETIVVCQREWLPEMEEWFEYRAAEGHEFGVLCPPISAEELRNTLQSHYKKKLKHVLLVGDVDLESVATLYNKTHKTKTTSARIASRKSWQLQNPKQPHTIHGIPTGIIPSKVGQLLKSEIFVASDNWLVDFDENGSPELAIGRWPVTSSSQIKTLIKKTIAYESPEFSAKGADRVEVVACGGGYGFMEDKLIESVTKQLLSDLVPAKLQLNMTYASWRSVYCPSPENFQKEFFGSLNRPSLFWVYIGHGAPWAIDVATFPDQLVPTLNKRTVRKMKPGGHPIAILIACSTGYFAGRSDSLSERMILHPNGPAAVFSGSGVTAPYGLSNLAFEMLSSFDQAETKSIGSWIAESKRAITRKRNTKKTDEQNTQSISIQKFRSMLDQLGKLFSPTGRFLHRERIEHAHMMTLFGDPLLRLPKTKRFPIDAKKVGDQWEISGTVPGNEVVEVEILYPRDNLGFRPKRRSKKKFHLPGSAAQMDFEYRKANQRLIANIRTKPESGHFAVHWTPDVKLPKKIWIRAKQVGADQTASGFTSLEIPKNQPKQESEKQKKDTQKYKIDGKPIELFNGKDATGWKASDFSGEEEVLIEEKNIRIEPGYPLAGIRFAGTKSIPLKKFPKTNYEVTVKAKKEMGEDFFAGITFPVGDKHCSFIPGGWGGSLTGLSSINGQDASSNKTKTFQKYVANQWYEFRVRVTDEKVECWVDKKKVVDQPRKGVKFSIRTDVEVTKPLGICNFQSVSLISSIRLSRLKKAVPPKQKSKSSSSQ